MMKLLSGCNKKATARATSPGSPILPRGCILRLAFSEVSLFHNFSVRGVLVCRGRSLVAQLQKQPNKIKGSSNSSAHLIMSCKSTAVQDSPGRELLH